MKLKKFTIEENEYISKNIQGYYRYEHYGYNDPRTPRYIYTLKNDFNDKTLDELNKAKLELKQDLEDEILQIAEFIDEPAAICVVPRSKVKTMFNKNQFFFLEAVKELFDSFKGNEENDGTNYIIRHTNTRKTHLNKSGYGGDGDMPYPGIANDTCHFSSKIKGKNILLIDDLYTKTVNIIEDMAQALFDHGAKSVTVFAIGYNMPKY